MKKNTKTKIDEKKINSDILLRSSSHIFSYKLLSIFIVGLILTLLSFIIDDSVFRTLTTLRVSSLIFFFSLITMIGNIEWFVVIVFFILAVFIFKKKKFYSFIAAIILSGLLSYALKMIILRPRPFEYFGIPSIIHAILSSFPSGHAMLIFTLLPFMLKNFPKYKMWFWTIAILVAFSRLYLGVHYLSDVIAGAFIGYMIGITFIMLGEKYGWK